VCWHSWAGRSAQRRTLSGSVERNGWGNAVDRGVLDGETESVTAGILVVSQFYEFFGLLNPPGWLSSHSAIRPLMNKATSPMRMAIQSGRW
jgi:hypothetical protein